MIVLRSFKELCEDPEYYGFAHKSITKACSSLKIVITSWDNGRFDIIDFHVTVKPHFHPKGILQGSGHYDQLVALLGDSLNQKWSFSFNEFLVALLRLSIKDEDNFSLTFNKEKS